MNKLELTQWTITIAIVIYFSTVILVLFGEQAADSEIDFSTFITLKIIALLGGYVGVHIVKKLNKHGYIPKCFS